MSQLVKLVESNKLIEFQKQDKFLEFINQEPPHDWLKPHPLNSSVVYLPIDKVELLLKRIFQEYKVEILREGQMLNAIYVTVRLHYKHPISGWLFQDGTGAVPIRVDKGKTASSLEFIKSDAISTGLPAAVSFAIKDAADRIGNIFGGNLNRKDTLDFSPMYTDKTEELVNEALEQLKTAKNLQALQAIFMGLKPKARVDARVIQLKDELKEKLQ